MIGFGWLSGTAFNWQETGYQNETKLNDFGRHCKHSSSNVSSSCAYRTMATFRLHWALFLLCHSFFFCAMHFSALLRNFLLCSAFFSPAKKFSSMLSFFSGLPGILFHVVQYTAEQKNNDRAEILLSIDDKVLGKSKSAQQRRKKDRQSGKSACVVLVGHRK